MLAPLKIIIIVSCSFQNFEAHNINYRCCEPYTLNRVITTKDMFNINDLIERIFIQKGDFDD
jgi:hypothetical protein